MFRSTRWYTRELERRERAWADERKELLDRIMYLADRPWNEPPAPEWPERKPVEVDESELDYERIT